jgi:hypothetical protein
MPLSGPGTFDSFFGDASDGDADFTGTNGGTLAKPSFFDTVLVGGAAGLEMSGNPLFCRRLVVDSSNPDLGFYGALHGNGQDANLLGPGSIARGALGGYFGGGGAGGLGARGIQGGVVPAQNGTAPSGWSLGGNGGNGAPGQNSPAGPGGAPMLLPLPYQRFAASFLTALSGMFPSPSGLVVPSGGGGGGGGGTYTSIGGQGGQGGGGGGINFVCAEEIVLIGTGVHFSARGGIGGSAAFGAGGGGGGGGGTVILTYGRITGTLKTNVSGGAGGTGFGNRAPAGVDGNVFLFQV